MANFNDISIISLSGLTSGIESSVEALVASVDALTGSQGLLLAPYRPHNLPGYISFIPISPMGYIEYSLFVLYSLREYVETNYCLIVQDDGWALDQSAWSDDFWFYDYIGAPTHLAINRETGNFHYHYSWTTNFDLTKSSHLSIIQNGGFSLRSKRLLEAPTRLAIPYSLPAPNSKSAIPHRLSWNHSDNLEDVQLMYHMRPKLDALGFNFSPTHIALTFSIEHAGPNLHNNLPQLRVFGHHSKLRKLVSYEKRLMDYQCTEQQAKNIFGEWSIVEMFCRLGYTVRFISDRHGS